MVVLEESSSLKERKEGMEKKREALVAYPLFSNKPRMIWRYFPVF